MAVFYLATQSRLASERTLPKHNSGATQAMNLHGQSGTVPSGDYARHRRATHDHWKHDAGQRDSVVGF